MLPLRAPMLFADACALMPDFATCHQKYATLRHYLMVMVDTRRERCCHATPRRCRHAALLLRDIFAAGASVTMPMLLLLSFCKMLLRYDAL